MAPLIVVTIAAATVAFGGVYTWAYIPLAVIAAAIGTAGVWRGGLPRDLRPLAWALAATVAAIGCQLIPLPRPVLQAISPRIIEYLNHYNLAFRMSASPAPLSIAPAATFTAGWLLAALSLYLVGVRTFLGDRSIVKIIRGLMIFAVPLALFGIYAREHDNGLIYWFWQPRDGGGSGQFGPFINRNHYAGWMIMVVPLLLAYLFGQLSDSRSPLPGARRRWTARVSASRANEVFLLAAALVVLFVSIGWSMSRSAWTAFAGALVVLMALVVRRDDLSARLRAGFVATVVVLVATGIVWRGPWLVATWYTNNLDIVTRLDAWRDGLKLVRDFPITGTGLNTYPVAMLSYQKRNPGIYVAQAHNDYLQLLAEGGALVTIPAACAILLLAWAIRRNLRAHAGARGYWTRAGAATGLAAIAAQEVVEFSLQIPVNAFLFCTLAAVALAPVERTVEAGAPREDTFPPHIRRLVCPACGSEQVMRSRSRNKWEAWRKTITDKRPFRCHRCRWRGWRTEHPSD